jgi:signal transduction histidine kinase/ligand-binding sensor domain-containing protein
MARWRTGGGAFGFWAVLASLLLTASTASAQYRIDHWTADNGLPQNSVFGIVQTRDGYLWLATVDGLARFDGARFTIFNKSNSPGIINNRFVSLFEDARGDLWAGTEESGIVRFSGGRFEHFGADAGIPRGVYWIVADTGGDGAIFDGDNQTIRFRDGKFSPFEAQANFSPPARAARSSSVKIMCRSSDSENNFLECLVNRRWIIFSLADGSPKEKFLSVAQAANSNGSRFNSVAQEANGTIWLITADGRVARAENGRVTAVFDERDGLPKYPLSFMTGSRLGLVAKDADGSLWLVDLPSMQKELLLKKAAVPPPLERPEILSTYRDGEDNLWFGTVRDGLFRARKQIITAYSEADGITVKNIYPIYEDRAGTIWIGATGGLFKYENGSFALIKSTRDFLVNAIGEDAAGRILISNGGVLYVQENNQFVPFERGKISYVGYIYAIHADRENALWIGGNTGLRRFKDGVQESFTTADGLAGNDVKVIIEARAGGLWIGTYDGLTHYKDGRFTSWREADGLPSRTVRSLYEDADGTLWIGSYDGGLARFKDGKFTRYNTKTGLPNDGAFQILEDDNRRFWISSNRGIYSVGKDELNEFADGRRANVTVVAYGKSDGMLNAECNGGRSPAGIRARDGRLWFPTQDGVAVIDPQNIKTNSQPPPVIIETIKIDNELSEPPAAPAGALNAADSKVNENSAAANSDLIINPNQQSFEIQYTALSFINSENLHFKYRLEGLDDDWIDAGTRRLAYFSHVPPGNYTFHVIAANSDGVWNEQGATLKIVVLPPFYRTWWFLLTCTALCSLIIYAIYRRRVLGLERARRLQEDFSRRLINANEAERRRIAGELHDSIGQSLAIIKNRVVLSAESVTDEKVRRQLELITAQTTQTIGEVREISYALRPYLLDNLGLTKAVDSLLDKITETSKLTIESELDDVDNVFDDEAEMSIYRIIQESLSNIMKHAEASEAQVFVKKSERNLTVLIADDGCGYDLNRVESRDGGEGGFGLLGISERVKMLGGTQEIESKVGGGTTVLIKIPVPSAGAD